MSYVLCLTSIMGKPKSCSLYYVFDLLTRYFKTPVFVGDNVPGDFKIKVDFENILEIIVSIYSLVKNSLMTS